MSQNDREKVQISHYDTIPIDLLQFIIAGAYSSCFSIMESRFRIFYNYLLDPAKKGEIKEPDGIFKISQCILVRLNQIDEMDTLRLFINIRNTIHSNGIHTKPDDPVKYSKGTILFETNKSSDLGDALDMLVPEILPIVIEILEEAISELKGEEEIIDPFAKSILS